MLGRYRKWRQISCTVTFVSRLNNTFYRKVNLNTSWLVSSSICMLVLVFHVEFFMSYCSERYFFSISRPYIPIMFCQRYFSRDPLMLSVTISLLWIFPFRTFHQLPFITKITIALIIFLAILHQLNQSSTGLLQSLCSHQHNESPFQSSLPTIKQFRSSGNGFAHLCSPTSVHSRICQRYSHIYSNIREGFSQGGKGLIGDISTALSSTQFVRRDF